MEGAFPLLLIGSVLVVYAGYLASESAGSHTSHLPLWGLIGCVGAVIVGAGVYSTFLEPTDTEALTTTVRTRTDRLTARAPPSDSGDRSRPSSTAETPIWWEGPRDAHEPEKARVSDSYGLPGARRPRAVTPPPRSSPPTARAYSSTFGPAPSRRYSLQELKKTLDELEAMVGGPPGNSLNATRLTGARTITACADCDRPFAGRTPSARCPGCGRGLCGRCSELSREEDGVLRCNECRARDR